MFGWLKKRPEAASAMIEVPAPNPDRATYAVGDIHGRSDLLNRMIDLIHADAGSTEAAVVFLGDYVDRGEQSAEVLRRLMALSQAEPGRITCLMGNHERMMLDFIDQGDAGASRWLRVGGLQTLASFGIGGVSETAPPDAIADAALRLCEALGPDLLDWVRRLPLSTRSGNVHFVHAGADPALGMEDQAPRTLLWGGAGTTGVPRRDGQWVVHGHIIVDAPFAERGYVNVDTGAWYTGRLTAACLDHGDIRFLST